LQTQEVNENPPPITILPTTDARIAAEYYLELIKQKVPIDVAKDLTIAYILKSNPFGQ